MSSPKTPPKPRHVAPLYFGIALITIAVFLVESVISTHMRDADLSVSADLLREGGDWREAIGRTRVLAAMLFLGFVTLVASALVIAKLAHPTSRTTRWMAGGVWLLIVLIALSPTLMSGPDGTAISAYGKLGTDLYEAALARGTVPGCDTATDIWLFGICGEVPALSLFDAMMDIVNLLAGLAVGAMVVGMVLCLDQHPTEETEQAAARLGQNLKDMRHQLYIASIVLTCGMFYATAWMNWPLPLIDEARLAPYRALILSTSLYTGVYFTLLILSFYLPVAFILNGRVQALAAQVKADATDPDTRDPSTWLGRHGLKEELGDHLRAGFALAAPILSAFAGGISPLAL